LVGHHVLVFRTNFRVPFTRTAGAYNLTTDKWDPVAAPPPFLCEENAPQEIFSGKAIAYYCPHEAGRALLARHQKAPGAKHDGLVFTMP
jgi:hypothetical protein